MLDLSVKKEPQFFTDFKKSNNIKTYQDCNDRVFKTNLKKHLLKEQKNQCFYCEKKIKNDTKKIHIDHIKQRSHYHNLECNYTNLVLSCNGNGEKHCAKYKDKQGKWDDNIYLDLKHEKVSTFFKFVSNGEITSTRNLDSNLKQKVDNTIEYLNLNHNILVNSRKTILLVLGNYLKQGFKKEEIFEQFGEFESLFK